ncbi:hypothetical protein ABT256_05485 [Amycolatopsis japonica]
MPTWRLLTAVSTYDIAHRVADPDQRPGIPFGHTRFDALHQ